MCNREFFSAIDSVPNKSRELDKFNRYQFGPSKFYRPTKGLCSLFLRTASRRTRKPSLSPLTASSPRRRSFAEVVKGKGMAAQGGANGGGFGQQGGRRGGPGFNPGFNPGFDPGFAGRGGRGYGSFPHNRGRGSNFGGGRSGYGGYGGYGSQNNYGYQGFHGANRGHRPYYGGYGGKRGRGAGYGGQQFQQQATPNPTPMGGDYGTGAHIADQMGQNLGAQQQHSTVPATGTKSATGGVPIAVTADNHLGSAVLGDPQPGHPSAGQELHQAPPAGLHKQGSKLELSPHRLVENKTTAEVPKDTVPHNPDNEPMNVDLPE